MPLIVISRHLAPFDKLAWNVFIHMFLIENAERGPVSFEGARKAKDCRSSKSKTSWGSDKYQKGSVDCPSGKSTTVTFKKVSKVSMAKEVL
jgi:hypothetical protein